MSPVVPAMVAGAAWQKEQLRCFPFKSTPAGMTSTGSANAPKPKRRPFGRHLARFAVLAALLAGGGVVLSEFHADHDGSGYQDWEQE